ncbi:MAG: hypothetical protein COU29_03230 [Candidatus Magasanikbacteria bacterium CG10_big_fil_rev_8_21_14_0_10_36_32]|uniref:PEGA domain-containing protein n=1 Tax=Candidatus Magasanikbacteria bacterium CG10_big_fil_rev_8_21_14_0_10_36_32 TaxID=1974646 RepID=A0A2M6W625_9BACT|nr:MAG: hypothetical protein COU29_03230 [Candidatus Magasanikbacteria bacterium CG10_big_fil_rev_8_21_14_0_10_36_32]
MDYPSSKLSKSKRRIILIIFVVSFFVISPIIILYTSGYRYDWHYGLLKETGAINIDILPNNASIYIDGLLIESKMPIKLNNRPPGKYNIKITAPGYYDWQKDIEVKRKQTVYIKGISLLKKNEPSILFETDLNNFSLSYDNRYVAYSVWKNKQTEVYIKDLSGKQENKMLLNLPGEKTIKIVWDLSNYFLIISDDESPHNLVYIINVDEPEKILDLVKQTRYPIVKYQWKESDEPELFFSTKLKIMTILPRLGQQYTLGKNNFLDWYIAENGRMWTMQIVSSTNKFQITEDTLGFNSIFWEEQITSQMETKLKFVAINQKRILLKKPDMSEMVILTKDKKFNISGEQNAISIYNNWWLIWTPWEIWTHSENEEPYLLTRSGEQLQQIVPLDRYNTLALVWEDKTSILFPYYLVSHNLLNYKIKDAVADPKKKIFYFIATINNQKGLWQLFY